MRTQAQSLCDEDSEYALIAILLRHPHKAIPEIQKAGLQDTDFFSGRAGWVLGAALRIAQAGRTVDGTTVSALLKKEAPALWDDTAADAWIEGALELERSGRATPGNIGQYVSAVRDWSVRRTMDEMLANMRESLRKPGAALEMIQGFQYETLQLTQRHQDVEWMGLDDMVIQAWPQIERNHTIGSPVTGIETSSEKLNILTTGLQPGEFHVWSAEPRAGKTSLMCHTALQSVFNQDKRVYFGSWEMPPYPITLKMLAARLEIPLRFLRTGRLDERQWERLISVMDGRCDEFPIEKLRNLRFLEAAGKTMPQFQAMIQNQVIRDGANPDLIMVDYLQIVEPHRGDKEHEWIANTSTALKNLAIHFNCPVVAASQLNAEGRIFGSRVPFQHAHVHLKIEREEEVVDGKKEVRFFFNLDKNRMGPVARWEVEFQGDFGTFADRPDPSDLTEPPLEEPPY